MPAVPNPTRKAASDVLVNYLATTTVYPAADIIPLVAAIWSRIDLVLEVAVNRGAPPADLWVNLHQGEHVAVLDEPLSDDTDGIDQFTSRMYVLCEKVNGEDVLVDSDAYLVISPNEHSDSIRLASGCQSVEVDGGGLVRAVRATYELMRAIADG